MAALGSLVVSLAMDTAKFTSDIGKASQQMARLTAEAGKIGSAIGGGVIAGLRSIGSLVKGAIDAADATSKMAVSVGMTTEELSRLAYAADLSGVSQEELGASLSKLARFAAEAAAGSKGANDVLRAMGITVQNTDGSLKSTSELLGDVAERFSQYEDGAAKTALAQKVFGESGARLIPLLNQGRDGMSELAAEANALGLTLTDKAGNPAEQFNDNLTRLQKAQEGLGRQIAQLLLPTLERLTNGVFDAAKNTDAFGRAAAIAANGVKILLSSGTLIIGVFDTLGTALGGVAATLVALFSGRFQDAFNIAQGVVHDFAGNIRRYAGTVSDIWDSSAAAVESKAPKLGGKLSAPIVTAAGNAAIAGRQIKAEIDQVYKQIENRLASLQFDVDTQGASDRIRGLIELARQGASGEQLQRFLSLSAAQESYRQSLDQAAESQRKKKEIEEEGLALTKSLRTPVEILNDEYDKQNRLLAANAISSATYARAVAKAQEDFAKATEETTQVSDKYAERAAENIQGFLGDSLQQAMQGNFKSIEDAFVSMINRMVAEAIAADLARLIFGGKAGSQGTMGLFQQLLNFLPGMFGGRAIGGPVTAGNLYKTNEHRGGAYPITDEWFVPSTAGTVVPGSKMGGMNITVNVKATPGMSRQTALQQGRDIGRGIQLATARNG